MMVGMNLGRHGLAFHTLSTIALPPDGRLAVRGGKTSGPDAAAFAALHHKLSDFARVLAPFRALSPPRLTAKGDDWGKLARHAIGIRALGRAPGRADFRELLRVILINIHDVVQDDLTDNRLRGLIPFDATFGSWLARVSWTPDSIPAPVISAPVERRRN